MNQIIERIKTRSRILIGLVIGFIVFTVLTVLLVDDFIQDVILVPFAYYIWLANIIIKALPQNCFITFLVVICLAIAIPSLRKSREKSVTTESPSELVPGEVAIWEQRLQYLKAGSYSSNRFAYHLGYLVVQILAYEERLATRTVINALETGEYIMPVNVRQYILMGIGSSAPPVRHPFWHQVHFWLLRFYKYGRQTQSIKQYNEIKAVLLYIEQLLKIVETLNDNPVNISESTQPEGNNDK